MTKRPKGVRRLLGEKRDNNMGLPLDYLRALRSDVIGEWRSTKRPKARNIRKWAKQVSDLHICIAAIEAELVRKAKAPKR